MMPLKRVLWSLEVHYPNNGWGQFISFASLKETREYRDKFFRNRPTRIQKWVKACAKTRR